MRRQLERCIDYARTRKQLVSRLASSSRSPTASSLRTALRNSPADDLPSGMVDAGDGQVIRVGVVRAIVSRCGSDTRRLGFHE